MSMYEQMQHHGLITAETERALQNVTCGIVSNSELRTYHMRAILMGIPPKQIVNVAQCASSASRALGVSFTHATTVTLMAMAQPKLKRRVDPWTWVALGVSLVLFAWLLIRMFGVL